MGIGEVGFSTSFLLSALQALAMFSGIKTKKETKNMAGIKIFAYFFAGVFAGKSLKAWGIGQAFPQQVYTDSGYILTAGDLVTLAIAVALWLFGGRIHSALRWFGLGMTVGVLADELFEVLHGKYPS